MMALRGVLPVKPDLVVAGGLISEPIPAIRLYHDGVSVFDAPDGTTYCFVKPGDITVKLESDSGFPEFGVHKSGICLPCG
jgi:hypothetical protein